MAEPGLTVLQVIPELEAGGAERTTLEIAEALKRENGRALIVSQGGRLEDELQALGGELIRLPVKSKSPFTLRRNADEIAKIILSENVDIVHARSRAPAWSALWAARRTHTPFVTTYHGTYGGKSAPKKLYNSVMARGDLVIANSNFIADHIKSTHGLTGERIITIPRGADTDHFNPANTDTKKVEEMRSDLSRGRRFIFVLPARLTAWKGQLVFLNAIANLPKSLQNQVSAHLIGDPQGRDEYLAQLKSTIQSLQIEEIVSISEHCRDMLSLYAASDLVLAPSARPEAFGRIAIEAGAMGVPSIVSDHGGQKETVLHGETGWRTPPGDAQALGEAMTAFLSMTDDERDAMGRAARHFVVSNYTKTNLQSKTLQVYKTVLSDKRERYD